MINVKDNNENSISNVKFQLYEDTAEHLLECAIYIYILNKQTEKGLIIRVINWEAHNHS